MSILNGRNDSLNLMHLSNIRMTNLNFNEINHSLHANEGHHSRHKFTATEDQRLRELINIYGENSWHIISSLMGNKNQRQCRERWINYLSFNSNEISKPWTKEEDRILILKYCELGAKWSRIAHELPGRSDMQVKLRFMKIYKNNKYILASRNKDTELKNQNIIDEKNKEQKIATTNSNNSSTIINNDFSICFEYNQLPSEIIKNFCKRSSEDFFTHEFESDFKNLNL